MAPGRQNGNEHLGNSGCQIKDEDFNGKRGTRGLYIGKSGTRWENNSDLGRNAFCPTETMEGSKARARAGAVMDSVRGRQHTGRTGAPGTPSSAAVPVASFGANSVCLSFPRHYTSLRVCSSGQSPRTLNKCMDECTNECLLRRSL